MTNTIIKQIDNQTKTIWRIAMGPPPGSHAPFRRHPDGKTYASVVGSMPSKPNKPSSPNPPLSRGKIAFLKGGKFENDLGNVLQHLNDVETNEPLLKEFIATNTPAENEDFLIQWRGKTIGLEAKNFGTSEGGQRAFVLQDGKLTIPDISRNRIHRACLPRRAICGARHGTTSGNSFVISTFAAHQPPSQIIIG